MALNGPFSVYYFVGPPGGAIGVPQEDYATAPTLAGYTYIFASAPEDCTNCATQANSHLKITGTSAITPILKDYVKIGQLESLDATHVKPFLIDRLRWRIVTVCLCADLIFEDTNSPTVHRSSN
jgi:tyrosinase